MEIPTGRTKVENRTSESCSVDFSELWRGSSEEWTHQDTLSERKKKIKLYLSHFGRGSIESVSKIIGQNC